MGDDDNGDLGFQPLLNRPDKVVGVRMNTMSMYKSSNGLDSSFGSGWDPVFSMAQNVEFRGSLMASANQIANSHLVQYPSDPCFVEPGPKLGSFGSGSFAEMVGSFGLPEGGLISNSGVPPNCPSNKEGGTGKTTNPMKSADHGAHFQEERQISDERAAGTSPGGKKRKRMPDTPPRLDPIQNSGLEQQKDVSQETLEFRKDQDDEKQKSEQNLNSRGKLTGKQYKDSSQNGEAPNDDFIHVRARRGQATNSHSLAERVRREKISQRMRFLQDLVPGCNKITGKAVMLDEIINYVQSLQRQVEFLSMKLATVNPEVNIDIERNLSKDILYSQGGPSAVLGFGPGMSTSHPHPHITQEGASPVIQSTNPHFPPISQITSVWNDELQNVFQMGFASDPDPNCLGLEGCMKLEL